MMTEIIVACISGVLALIGAVLSNRASSNKIQQQLEIHQAVQETKLENLTREVREHNNFAKRMPVLEERIMTINGRIDALERKVEAS